MSEISRVRSEAYLSQRCILYTACMNSTHRRTGLSPAHTTRYPESAARWSHITAATSAATPGTTGRTATRVSLRARDAARSTGSGSTTKPANPQRANERLTAN